jgi:hypothetical protein
MHPTLYFALALTYADAAIRSFRARSWSRAIREAITALIYACLAILSLLPAAVLTNDIQAGGL